MSKHCIECGSKLIEFTKYLRFWITLYKCPMTCNSYIEVGDSRWIYPLLILERGVLEKCLQGPDELIEACANKSTATIQYSVF
jgi:hypothetical protein